MNPRKASGWNRKTSFLPLDWFCSCFHLLEHELRSQQSYNDWNTFLKLVSTNFELWPKLMEKYNLFLVENSATEVTSNVLVESVCYPWRKCFKVYHSNFGLIMDNHDRNHNLCHQHIATIRVTIKSTKETQTTAKGEKPCASNPSVTKCENKLIINFTRELSLNKEMANFQVLNNWMKTWSIEYTFNTRMKDSQAKPIEVVVYRGEIIHI